MSATAPTRILPPRLARFARELKAAESVFGVEAAMLAAIIDRESLGGDALSPRGPAGKGDGGHGHGICQIDDRSHSVFLMAQGPNGVPLWTIPWFSIGYVCQWILLPALRQFGDWPCAIAAYNAGPKRVRQAMAGGGEFEPLAMRLMRLDSVTTGSKKSGGRGDYVSDVLRRRAEFIGVPPDAIPEVPR